MKIVYANMHNFTVVQIYRPVTEFIKKRSDRPEGPTHHYDCFVVNYMYVLIYNTHYIM